MLDEPRPQRAPHPVVRPSEPSEAIEQIAVPADALDAFGAIPDAARGLERLSISRRPELPGVELWSVRRSVRLWTVYHTAFHFCVAPSPPAPGEQLWRYRGNVHSMTQGCTMLLEPGELHQTLRIPPADFLVMGLDVAWMEQRASELTHGRPLHFGSGHLEDSFAEELLGRCARAFLAGSDALVVEDLLFQFLVRALERAGETGPGAGPGVCSKGVQRALEYIRDNYASRLTLDEIAGAANVSKYHLHRSFRSVLGLPMHRYLLEVRLGQALRRLRRGEEPRFVAAETGFADQAHLNRHLRARFGMTPGWYRSSTLR